MATKSVALAISMAVCVHSIVIKATKGRKTLQQNVERMALGLGPPPAAVSCCLFNSHENKIPFLSKRL